MTLAYFLDKSEIYMVINKITGKRYIGQVKCYYGKNKAGIEHRWKKHVSSVNEPSRGCPGIKASIEEYGAHNHLVKLIWICPNDQANYWEAKFVRQYNTQEPNGLNIYKGGNLQDLSGENNPMWGKTHSESTRKKISDALTGVPLTATCKKNMSKAHAKNMEEGRLPPRRVHNDLPKYIYHVKSANKEGYEIRHHPTLKQKQFTAKSITMEENLERAKAYLADINNPANQKEQRTSTVVYDNLPRYVRHVRAEKYEGFEVKCHPKLGNKKWTVMSLSMETKLQKAKDYLETANSK